MRRRAIIALTGALALALSACTQPAEQAQRQGGPRNDLSIATGTQQGTYFPVGGAMAEIIKKNVEGVSAQAETTGGSVENLRLIGSGESDLATVQGDAAYLAENGEQDFKGEPVENRALMVMYPNVYHAVSLKSINDKLKMRCFADIKGKRFSVGAPGSGNEVATKAAMSGVGLSDKDIRVQRYAYAETARALQEGQLDAGSWVIGEGSSSLKELEASEPIHLIPFCDDERKKLTDDYDYYAEHTIKAGTYSTVQDDVPTIALWNILVVKKDFPEDQAYELVKALYENIEDVYKVYEPGREYFQPDMLKNSTVPLHPAAVRYAEEKGVEIPDDLKP